MEKNGGEHRGAREGSLWYLLMESTFSAFTFCMGQKLIEVAYERKLTIVKKS